MSICSLLGFSWRDFRVAAREVLKLMEVIADLMCLKEAWGHLGLSA